MSIKDQLDYVKDVVDPTLDAAEQYAESVARKDNIEAYAVDGAIDAINGIAYLTKAGVGAYTLAAPSADNAGQHLYIVSDSANAHVVTATNLIEDGVTGGPKDTMTFAAFKGAAIHLVALNEKWYVVAKNLVTVAAV